MRRSSLERLAALALTLGACAAPGAPPAAESTPLERALASIDSAALAADIGFLADDALQGRDSPSPEQRIAARYLQARLAPLGFAPGTSTGGLHVYGLDSKRVDPRASSARWLSADSEPSSALLLYGVDFGVHPSDAGSARSAGEVVFAGTGSAADLERCELQGRWALCVEQRFGRRRTLQRAVAQAGALGLICVGPGSGEGVPAAGSSATPFSDWAEASTRMRPSQPRAEGSARENLPCAWFDAADCAQARGRAVGEVLPERFLLEVVGGGRLELENVAALWPGDDPELAGEVIVVSAHYDHVGVGRDGQVYNGADDNASGSAALLALAEALAAHGPLARSVLLLWVSSEELGLYGSLAWCRAPDLPAGLVPVADINLDMVGRNAPEYIELTPSPEHAAFNPLAAAALELIPLEGFAEPRFVDQDFERSDQAAFHTELAIPVVYLSTGEHEDYHEPGDDAGKVDAEKVARVTRLTLRLLQRMQSAPLGQPAPP